MENKVTKIVSREPAVENNSATRQSIQLRDPSSTSLFTQLPWALVQDKTHSASLYTSEEELQKMKSNGEGRWLGKIGEGGRGGGQGQA